MSNSATVKVNVSQRYLNKYGKSFTPAVGEVVEVMGDTYVEYLVEMDFVELYDDDVEEVVDVEPQPVLTDLSMSELKEIARERGIEKVPRKRADLLELLEE